MKTQSVSWLFYIINVWLLCYYWQDLEYSIFLIIAASCYKPFLMVMCDCLSLCQSSPPPSANPQPPPHSHPTHTLPTPTMYDADACSTQNAKKTIANSSSISQPLNSICHHLIFKFLIVFFSINDTKTLQHHRSPASFVQDIATSVYLSNGLLSLFYINQCLLSGS